MKAKSIFAKMNAGFNDLPILGGANIFLRSEYQKEIGISEAQTIRRLNRLEGEMVVRRVRTCRNGRIVQAWEFIGA